MLRNYRIVFSLAAAFVLAGALSASAATSSTDRASDSATGCLQKGDKPDTYKLVTKDGKSWDVWSKKVSLAGHVGHTVTLTGDVMKGGMKGDKMGMKDTSMSKMGMKDTSMSKMGMKDTSMSKMGMGDSSKMSGMGMSSGSMNVSAMSMVSATCS